VQWNGNSKEMLERCLMAVKEKIDALDPSGKRVAVNFFQAIKTHGCGGHGSVEDHAILAKELVPFFKKLLDLIKYQLIKHITGTK
jgi:hypothetical protein